jgi:hypothetical protein
MDAVVCWVDGSDPDHVSKRKDALNLAGFFPAVGVSSERFASCNEIELCLESILKFAPFFGTIFVVTDNQTPTCLDRLKQRFPEAKTKIVLVDHKVIYAGHEDLLPTFCSGAIETMLFNIPGLDDEFVYFNDDFFLLREVSPEDFFVDGRVQLRGAWQSSLRQALKLKFLGLGVGRASRKGISRNEQMWRAAVLAGETKRYLFNDHTPHPMHRSTMASFFEKNPDQLRHNAGFRFRSQPMFQVTALSDHLEIHSDTYDFRPLELCYVEPSDVEDHATRLRHQLRVFDTEDHKFGCIQTLNNFEAEARALLIQWLHARGFEASILV